MDGAIHHGLHAWPARWADGRRMACCQGLREGWQYFRYVM